MDDVLVVGGKDAKGLPSDQANVFASSTGWRSASNFGNGRGQMANARAGFTATWVPSEDSIFVLLAGGADQTNHARPTAGSYQDYGSSSNRSYGFMPVDHTGMSVARMDHSATLLPDKDVLLAAGRNDTGPLASTELFHTGVCSGGTSATPSTPPATCSPHGSGTPRQRLPVRGRLPAVFSLPAASDPQIKSCVRLKSTIHPPAISHPPAS